MDVFVGLLVLIGCCACQNTIALNDVANKISDRELLLELIHHVNALEERGRKQQKLIEEQDLEHRKEIHQLKELIQKQNDEIQRLVETCQKDNSNMPVYKREERIRRDERVVRNSRRLFKFELFDVVCRMITFLKCIRYQIIAKLSICMCIIHVHENCRHHRQFPTCQKVVG